MVFHYDDFYTELLGAGFSMAGGNDEGIFSLIAHGWNEEVIGSPLRWHSGDADSDPWEWRIRVLEKRDVAYGKLFFRKAGFITAEWYPYFLAARRGSAVEISGDERRIYDVVSASGGVATEEIKRAAGFEPQDKSKFDKAITGLQMQMFITVQGQKQISSWPSAVFTTCEDFFNGTDVFEKAAKISMDESIAAIGGQVRKLNPNATDKKIMKFIKG